MSEQKPSDHATSSPEPQASDDGRVVRSTAEWASLVVSIVIVASLVSVIAYYGLARSATPVRIEIVPEFSQVREERGQFYLPITITNRGGNAATAVTVSVTLAGPDGSAEEIDFTLDLLDGGESERAVVIFSSEPTEDQLTIGPLSYLEP